MTRNLVQRAGDVASAPNLKYTPEGWVYSTLGAENVPGTLQQMRA